MKRKLIYFSILLSITVHSQNALVKVRKQKHLVEDKQKEILDSIRYAKRIQSSLLPNENFMERTMRRLGKRT